jgi:TatA/E family protein of Tat protein translocase
MLNLDPGKLLVIGVVAIILLGPDRLPQVARQLGGAWRSFNEFRHRMESEVRNTMPDLPPTSEIARLARTFRTCPPTRRQTGRSNHRRCPPRTGPLPRPAGPVSLGLMG